MTPTDDLKPEVSYYDRCGACGALWLGSRKAIRPGQRLPAMVFRIDADYVLCDCGARWNMTPRLAGLVA